MYDDLAHLLYLFHWPIWFKALHVLDGPESAGDYNEVQSMKVLGNKVMNFDGEKSRVGVNHW